MSQSSYVTVILIGMFILFLAAKGRLAPYGQALWGAKSDAATGVATPTAATGDPVTNTVVNIAKKGILQNMIDQAKLVLSHPFSIPSK